MKNVTLTFQDFNNILSSFRVYFSATTIDLSNLPLLFFNMVAGTPSFTFNLDDTIKYGLISLTDGSGNILMHGRQFVLSDTQDADFTSVIPTGIETLLYLHAEDCTTATAKYQLLGNTLSTNFSGTMSKTSFNGQDYLNPNRLGWLQFPSKIITNKSLSIFAKVRAPTTATETSYRSSNPIVVSDNNSYVQDVIFGFSSVGLFLWSERGTIGNSTNLATGDTTIYSNRNQPSSIFCYIPALATVNPHVIGNYDGITYHSPTGLVDNANHQLEGLFRTQPSTQNGWLGDGALLRSILVLAVDLTEIQMRQIQLAMSQE